ncbi:hypothetical protein GDO78_005744 [Eleutherodactylus coqui]|uniref:Armadillo repeat-containing domain-containing protein n=1 Tax=Eleutherodactylus coqui TaxID=57060 RepID=A0A8J6FL41_ELECQ|nr:hypothetical protein GDO78_005744 [Eleutherodactylus coqui]
MEDYFPSLLKLMEEGNDMTKIHIMKILVNLSANPCMTAPLLASKAPSSLTFLFDSSINRDILIRALTFAANLSENLGRDQQHDGHCYNEGSFHALLFKDPAALQINVAPLLLMPDMEIKEQVSRCIRSAERLKPYCS